jgi:branched-chain amino acid aminotransferase
MRYINFNGKLVDENVAVFDAASRLRFGDGFFESMRMFHGKVAFIDEHFERIMQSVVLLKMQLPDVWSKAFLENEISKLADINKCRFGRVRIQFYRVGAGRYLPNEHRCGFLMEIENDSMESYALHILKTIDVSIQYTKSIHNIGNVKSGSALLHVLASIEAKTRTLDEMILLNTSGNICEALASNFFMVSDGIVFTPPLESGCVDGVMRKKTIEILLSTGVAIYERNCSVSDLKNANEVFLTNASKGLQTVERFGNNVLASNEVAELLTKKLNRLAVQ